MKSKKGGRRTGPAKKAPGESFGLINQSFPVFKDLAPEVKVEAASIVAQALGGISPSDVAMFANSHTTVLEDIATSPLEVGVEALKLLFSRLYTDAGRKYQKQNATRVKGAIKKILKKDLPLNGHWEPAEAILYIGSAACSVTGRSSATRPYLPLVGALILLWEAESLIAGMEPETKEEDLIPVAA